MMRFAESVRARLAFWHTVALAALLFLSAGATYVLLARTMSGRTDQYLAETTDALRVALLAEYEEDSSGDVAATQALDAFRFRDLTVVMYDSSWHVVASTIGTEPASRSGRPRTRGPDQNRLRDLVRASASADSGQRFISLDDDEGGYRAYALPVRLGLVPYTAVAVHSLHAQTETLEAVRTWYLIAIPLALLLAWIVGYLLARRSLLPAESMGRTAARISAANLSERLPIGNPRDEIGQLATVLNALLARVDDALEQQRRFTADASHELRSPLAALQSEADIALARKDRSAEDYSDAIALMSRTTRRMSTIVDDLFLLARADSGEQALRPTRLYLDELIVECIETTRSLASLRDIAVRFDGGTVSDRECEYMGDEQLLRRIIINLLDNALKYSCSGSEVVVSLTRAPTGRGTGDRASWRLTVADNGPGIPAPDQPYVFDRFYRVDTARTYTMASPSMVSPSTASPSTRPYCSAATEPGGAGLGLAISRWIAEAHGGELRLDSSTPEGSVFVLVLPAVDMR